MKTERRPPEGFRLYEDLNLPSASFAVAEDLGQLQNSLQKLNRGLKNQENSESPLVLNFMK